MDLSSYEDFIHPIFILEKYGKSQFPCTSSIFIYDNYIRIFVLNLIFYILNIGKWNEIQIHCCDVFTIY